MIATAQPNIGINYGNHHRSIGEAGDREIVAVVGVPAASAH
jgi:hypothetical protein